MTSDIYQHPERYHLVQFTVDGDGYMKPIWTRPFQLVHSKRHPGQDFLSPPGSQFGIRKIKNATHWAIVHERGNKLEVLHHGPLETLTTKKRIVPFNRGDNFLIMRSSRMYMSVYISNQEAPVRQTVLQKATS